MDEVLGLQFNTPKTRGNRDPIRAMFLRYTIVTNILAMYRTIISSLTLVRCMCAVWQRIICRSAGYYEYWCMDVGDRTDRSQEIYVSAYIS